MATDTYTATPACPSAYALPTTPTPFAKTTALPSARFWYAAVTTLSARMKPLAALFEDALQKDRRSCCWTGWTKWPTLRHGRKSPAASKHS